MKAQRLVIAGLVVIVLLLASYGFQQQHVARAFAGQWEYAQVGYLTDKHQAFAVVSDSAVMGRINDDFAAIFKQYGDNTLEVYYLDKMGDLGWEMASEYTTSDGVIITFKRPKD